MRKYLNYLLVITLISSCASEPESQNQVIETTSIITSTTSSSTSTTVQKVKEDISYDKFGIELLDVSPEMKEQFDELVKYVEKKTGLSFVEYPKFNLYTLDGYRDYNAASYLDDFNKDYEEGEWERAVLSQNMWGLNDLSPEELLDLQVEFQRCFSAGSYNLLDKILRVPIKKNQKKLNLYEQSVVIHELVHSLQGQHFATDEWYEEMDNLDDFTYYYGFVALMEAQAEYVEGKYLLGFDTYDRQDYISQIPNIQCRVSLPSYFYIPAELYYEFGPILADQIIKNGKMEALNSALFGYINNGLNTLPTSEQIYDPARFFIDERYEELTSKTIELDNYILIDEGSFGALDLVYLMQDKIGQTNAINAAVGIGGGSWKDYEDSSGNLLMTLKLTGDDKNELQEIYEAFTLWANAQSRFSSSEPYLNGILFKGSTNFWIYSDQSFIRIVLSQDLELLNSISDQLNEF